MPAKREIGAFVREVSSHQLAAPSGPTLSAKGKTDPDSDGATVVRLPVSQESFDVWETEGGLVTPALQECQP